MACTANTCGTASWGQSLSLQCEKTDTILSVSAIEIATNPTKCSDQFPENVLSSVCDLDKAKQLLETECKGAVSCNVDAQSIIEAACSGTTSALQLHGRIDCQEFTGIDTLTILILCLYFVIVFGLSATLTKDVFVEIWRNKKRAFLIGWLSQFGFMPLMAFALSHIFQLSALNAIGVILCGCAPGGVTSNLLTYWVNGNVALSISMSIASTVCCFFMIPLLFLIYIKSGFAAESAFTLPLSSIIIPLVIMIVACVMGLLLRKYNKENQCGCAWARCYYWRWAEKLASYLGFFFLVAAFVTGVRDDPELLVPSDFPKLWAIGAMFQPLGGAFGYLMALLFRLHPADRRAICLETGVQSYPLVLALVGLSWTGCDKIQIRAFVIIGTFWYLLSTAWMIILMQLVCMSDSCLQRCFKRSGTLSKSLPKVQSVEVVKAAGGDGEVRRLTADELPTHGKFGSGVDDCYSMFARAASLFPHNRCFGSRQVLPSGSLGPFVWTSYHTAHAQVLQLGSGVAKLQLQPKGTFGMYSANSAKFQIATLGMMSQGHTCVPIYDTLGEDIVEYEANHAELQIMFVESAKLKKVANVLGKCETLKYIVALSPLSEVAEDVKVSIKSSGATLLGFDELLVTGKESPTAAKPAQGDDLAFIMYTSGTTDKPKGVCIKQRSLVIGASYCAGLELLPSDRYLSYLPLAHIFETMVEHGMLAHGAAIGFFGGNIKKLQDDIITLKPTVFAGVPRVYQRFYEAAYQKIGLFPGPLKALLSHALASEVQAVKQGQRSAWGKFCGMTLGKAITGGKVRIMISGAAPLPLHVHEFLVAACGCAVLQGYGMTENCANATLELFGDNRSGHVGPPMPTVEIKLEDVPEMNYTTKTREGEVLTRTPCNFAGYHKNAEETAKVLQPDGWLHTGDIGRWNEDGTLSIIDRKKNIFKLSQGEYVAAEKIEMVVSKSKYISQPWVYGNSFQSMLVAVVTPDYAELAKAAAEGGWNVNTDDLAALASSKQAKKFILAQMDAEIKAAKLKPFEFPKAVHLEHRLNELNQGFSIDNDCLTPTFKLKRPQLLKRYDDEVKAMYNALLIGDDADQKPQAAV